MMDDATTRIEDAWDDAAMARYAAGLTREQSCWLGIDYWKVVESIKHLGHDRNYQGRFIHHYALPVARDLCKLNHIDLEVGKPKSDQPDDLVHVKLTRDEGHQGWNGKPVLHEWSFDHGHDYGTVMAACLRIIAGDWDSRGVILHKYTYDRCAALVKEFELEIVVLGPAEDFPEQWECKIQHTEQSRAKVDALHANDKNKDILWEYGFTTPEEVFQMGYEWRLLQDACQKLYRGERQCVLMIASNRLGSRVSKMVGSNGLHATEQGRGPGRTVYCIYNDKCEKPLDLALATEDNVLHLVDRKNSVTLAKSFSMMERLTK